MKGESVLVSACLMGVHCRYDGRCQDIPEFAKKLPRLMERYNLIPVCPEILGGMATPRVASERKDGAVVNKCGEDVSTCFERGAVETLNLARLYGCRYAILKQRSPSCGCGQIYDGTFTGTLTKGDGVTAQLLKCNGIAVFNEENCFDMC